MKRNKKALKGQNIQNSNVILEMESDIEMEPEQYSYKEIEQLYFEHKHFKNIPNRKSIFPNVKLYIEAMDQGQHPFETFQDETFLELDADTSALRIFMEEIKVEFDKEKFKNSNYTITF